MNEKWKIYCINRNDFKENENPFKFLQDGNVLIVDNMLTDGFEWTTVILIEEPPMGEPSYDCNQMMRCTTNLIIVRKEKEEYEKYLNLK